MFKVADTIPCIAIGIAKFVDGKFVGTVEKPAWSNNSTVEQVQKNLNHQIGIPTEIIK